MGNKQKKQATLTEKEESKSMETIILLGSALSGKTTLYNQLKYIYGKGFSSEELIKHKKLIYYQMISQIIKLIDIRKQNTTLPTKTSDDKIKQIINNNNKLLVIAFINTFFRFKTYPPITNLINEYIPCFMVYSDMIESRHYVVKYFQDNLEQIDTDNDDYNFMECTKIKFHLKGLWNESSIKYIFKLRKEFKINSFDSTEYFLDNIDKVLNDHYIPTKTDILRLSYHTRTINTQIISINGGDLQIIDVGGLKHEIKKLNKIFEEGVSRIIFTASLSCYDEFMYGQNENEISWMRYQISLFREICCNPKLKNAKIIIFFTKNDIFKSKLSNNIPLTVIPQNSRIFYDIDGQYNNNPTDYDQCKSHIFQTFLRQHHNPYEEEQTLPISKCYINLLDQESVKRYMESRIMEIEQPLYLPRNFL